VQHAGPVQVGDVSGAAIELLAAFELGHRQADHARRVAERRGLPLGQAGGPVQDKGDHRRRGLFDERVDHELATIG